LNIISYDVHSINNFSFSPTYNCHWHYQELPKNNTYKFLVANRTPKKMHDYVLERIFSFGMTNKDALIKWAYDEFRYHLLHKNKYCKTLRKKHTRASDLIHTTDYIKIFEAFKDKYCYRNGITN
jgi:hypothetical protein